MFAYILRVEAPQTPETAEFFLRFTREPGLLNAFDLAGVDDPDESVVVAVWEDPESAHRYLDKAPLRMEVDEAFPSVTRTMYNVLSSK